MPAAAPQSKRAAGADAPAKRKRRRRNVRTAVSDSDSSDSNSSDSSSESEAEKEVEMLDAPTVESDSEGSSAEEEGEEEAKRRVFTEKSGRIPSPLRDLHDPQADARFEEYYMRLMTGEFGDDLNAVRQAKDFTDRSLPVLVRALRQGINIFSADEKRVAVGKAN